MDVGPTEHRLQYTYGLWYIGKTNYQQYDLTLKKIGRFASVEQFWALYSHLVRPSDLNSPSDFFLFKDGIKPMWEHKVIILYWLYKFQLRMISLRINTNF